MKFGLQVVAVVAAMSLAGCVTENIYTPPDGQKVPISKSALDFFQQEYLPKVGSIHSGVFALSQSGRSAGYALCPEDRCIQSSYGNDAIKECASDGEKCFIFAVGQQTKYEYELLP